MPQPPPLPPEFTARARPNAALSELEEVAPEEVPTVLPVEEDRDRDEDVRRGYDRPIASLLGPTWTPDIRRQPGEPATPALNRMPLDPLPEHCPPAVAALGEPQATLKPRIVGRIVLIVIGVLVMVVGLLIGVLLLAAPAAGPRGRDNIGSGVAVLLISIGGGALMAGLGLWSLIRNAGKRLWLCPGGVVLQAGAQVECLPWERFPGFYNQVTKTDHYTNGVFTGTTWTYCMEIEDRDGRRLRFDSGSFGWAVKAIGDRIQRESSSALFTVAIKALEEGKPVDFYPFVLTDRGIEYRDDFLRWRDVGNMQVQSGSVRLVDARGTRWAQRKLGDVAHSLLFLTLTQYLIEKHRTG